MTSTRSADNALILTDVFGHYADVGTALPTDTTTDLPAGWTEFGWLDPTGFSETPTGSVTDLKGVNGATLAQIKDGDGWEFDMVCLESIAATDSILYAASTPATVGSVTTTQVKAATAPRPKAWCFTLTYSNGVSRRVALSKGNGSVTGAIQNVYNDFRKIPLKVAAIQDSNAVLFTNIADTSDESSSSSSSSPS